MFYGLSKFIKNLLPKRLFYRGLLIVAVPVVVLQITISLVFFDSLWIKSNKGMTKSLVSEIVTIIDIYNNDFLLKLEGFEGPIDLLLNLARNQKVDLSKISILKLADQYLEYINFVKIINLEIASDYLVMAAWLTYLKSKILLPKKSEDEPTAEQLEEAVRFQLRRLEAMQKAAKNLFNLPQMGINTFYRGNNNGVKYKYKVTYTSSLYDLLKGYSDHLNNKSIGILKIKTSDLFSVENIITKITKMITSITDWMDLSTSRVLR